MILSNVCVPKLSNKKFKNFSPDTVEDCRDKKYFLNYPFDVIYEFNSRGFRDVNWPDDLSDVVWCLGDSATQSIGLPDEFSWPSQLEKITGKKTINLGLRSTSNFTISQIAVEILKYAKPSNVLILWSFFERRPIHDHKNFLYLQEGCSQLILDDDNDHLTYFQTCLSEIMHFQSDCNVIHGFVPMSWIGSSIDSNEIWQQIKDPSWPTIIDDLESLPADLKNEIQNVHTAAYENLSYALTWKKFKKNLDSIDDFTIEDSARDGWHWGRITNCHVAESFSKKLKK